MEKPVPSSPQAAQFLNDVLRQHYAQQIPRAHVPLGVGTFRHCRLFRRCLLCHF